MKLTRLAAVGAGVTALFGSCCVLPLLLLSLTGTVGFASALVPFQKYFTALTFVLLGTAFWLVYGRKRVVCEDSRPCSPKGQRVTKVLLWGSTLLALLFLLGPRLLSP